jgi:hypothetical protein
LLSDRQIVNLKNEQWFNKTLANILPIMFGCLFLQKVDEYLNARTDGIHVINSGLTFAGHALTRIGVPMSISLGVKVVAATLDIMIYRPART